MSSLDNAVVQCQDVVELLQNLQVQETTVRERLRQEEQAYAQLHERATKLEAEHSIAVIRHDEERRGHSTTREELVEHRAVLGETRSALQQKSDDLTMLHKHSENQRQDAHVQLREKDNSLQIMQKDADTLHRNVSQVKSDLAAALLAQDAYRREYRSTTDELERARGTMVLQSDELCAQQTALEHSKATAFELSEEHASVRSRLEKDLAESRAETEELRSLWVASERQRQETELSFARCRLTVSEGQRDLQEAREDNVRLRAELIAAQEKGDRIQTEFGKIQHLLRGKEGGGGFTPRTAA
eukprot:TRINITY_DN75458_c0_g1_i1.p1 TRINITY_DN75458_c0_g1~~TRINITY_DN75458_c0_g1_i1.p1  ORF type:complete len:301 (-),score=53.60 TRINITY_DN75458_c0_g1_i1:241-1143(-)